MYRSVIIYSTLQCVDGSGWKDGTSRLPYLRAHEPSALEIAAEQMRLWPNIDPRESCLLVCCCWCMENIIMGFIFPPLNIFICLYIYLRVPGCLQFYIHVFRKAKGAGGAGRVNAVLPGHSLRQSYGLPTYSPRCQCSCSQTSLY